MSVRTPRLPARRTAGRQQTVRLVTPAPEPQPGLDLGLDSETGPATKPGTGPITGPGRPLRPIIALTAVLVLALSALVWAGLRWYDANQLAGAHQAALAAAKQTTVDFVSISASSVDGDLQRIATGATGDFKDEFTRGMPQVRQAVVENKVESTGQVLRAGLVSGDLDSAVVLVAIDASVKNVGAPDGRVSHYRIQVDLALDPDSGRWLVSRLQFVG
jgi:Mce-associated membrane protein